MAKTLYVSDLDGTLLSVDSRVSPRTAQIISQLSADGALITVATARTPATVVPLLANTRLNVPPVVMTGAGLWDMENGVFESCICIPQEQGKSILDEFVGCGISPFVYLVSNDRRSLDVYHDAAMLNDMENTFYWERANLPLKRFHIGQAVPADDMPRALLFYAMGQADRINSLAQRLRDEYTCSVSCYPDIFNPQLANLEIMAPKVSKAAAIKELAERYKVERIVVFGDNLNDIPMFEIADEAIAVGNAVDAVKAAATHIIAPNYTDSVATYIAHHHQ